MNKRKIVKTYIYPGFGFPIILQNVPLIQLRGIWTPDIAYNKLQNTILLALTKLPVPLTGNHLRFIRACFELTLEAFGEKFGVTHAAVLKWEKRGDEQAHLSLATEREIRLLILDTLLPTAKAFRTAYKLLIEQRFVSDTVPPLSIEIDDELYAKTG